MVQFQRNAQNYDESTANDGTAAPARAPASQRAGVDGVARAEARARADDRPGAHQQAGTRWRYRRLHGAGKRGVRATADRRAGPDQRRPQGWRESRARAGVEPVRAPALPVTASLPL